MPEKRSITKKRIIPCLDIKDGNVVKGINFVGLAEVGDPIKLAKDYEKQGADEVVFLDITGGTSPPQEECEGEQQNNTPSIFDLVKQAAKELLIPLTLGGGIRCIEDFHKALDCGASKVSINSAAVANPALLEEAAGRFGKQSIVIAIDGKKDGGSYKVFVKGGRENTGLDLIQWVKQCEALGVGEILLTSIDADGTQSGYDLAMTKAVCEAVTIPVIASGGCGKTEDIIKVFQETDCDAALAASLFHYGKATIKQVKTEMERNRIPCKP